MLIFCTLFDSFYLDKGIVMYQSIAENTKRFKLYVLCMDDRAYTILSDLAFDNLVPINLNNFMTPELISARENRSRAEFCWTCSSCIIEYVLDTYGEDICTYIDADLYFYKDPTVLLEELGNASIGIIEHRNNPNFEGKYYDRIAGPYCVEFNTFRNDENGRTALKWWKNQCLKCCTAEKNGKTFGDQKYLEDWPTRFRGVHVYENLGAGMAPWNVAQYKLTAMSRIQIEKREVIPVFYHFHAIEYISEELININVYYRSFKTDEKLVDYLYYPYLNKIKDTRMMLEKKYGMNYNVGKKENKKEIKEVIKKLAKKRTVEDIVVWLNVSIKKFFFHSKDILSV